jgi:hypothetical protein
MKTEDRNRKSEVGGQRSAGALTSYLRRLKQGGNLRDMECGDGVTALDSSGAFLRMVHRINSRTPCSQKAAISSPHSKTGAQVIQGGNLIRSLGRQTVDRAEQEAGKTTEGQLSLTWSRHPPPALIHALASEATGIENLRTTGKSQVWAKMGLLLATVLLAVPPCFANTVIHDETDSRCWFAGSEVTALFRVSGIDADQATGRWRLSSAGHTVARGETSLAIGNGTVPFTITFALPELNDGVAVDLSLELSVTDTRSRTELAATNKLIRSFSPKVFVGREEWLKSLDITLFDSEKATVILFDDAGIPYRFLRNAEALAEITQGIVIVGEGVSTQENRGLWEQLIKVASRGVPVLCLALREGEVALPGIGPTEMAAKPSALTMKRYRAITDVDKRLDKTSWCGERKVASHSIVFEGERGPVAARVQEGRSGWLWLEQSFEGVESQLVLCQFLLVKHWERSPVPRVLLLKVLETVCPKKRTNKRRSE